MTPPTGHEIESNCVSGYDGEPDSSVASSLCNQETQNAQVPMPLPQESTEWKFEAEVDEYQLEWEDHVVDELLTFRFKELIKNLNEKSIVETSHVWPEESGSRKKLPLFLAVAEGLLENLTSHMKMRATQLKLTPIQDWEVYMWLGMIQFFDRIGCELETAITMVEPYLARKNDSLRLLTVKRYKELWKCMCTFDPSECASRSGIDIFAHLRDLEEASFSKTLKMCFSGYMCFVLDDEFVTCRSKCYQSNEYRSDETRHIIHSLGSSFLPIRCAIHHQQKLGCSQVSKGEELLNTAFSGSALARVIVAANCNHSCMELWKYLASIDVGFVMATKNGENIGHPFKNQSDINEMQINKPANSHGESSQLDVGCTVSNEENTHAQLPQSIQAQATMKHNQGDVSNSVQHNSIETNRCCATCQYPCGSEWIKTCLKCNCNVHNMCAQAIGLPESIIGCVSCVQSEPTNSLWQLDKSEVLDIGWNVSDLRKRIAELASNYCLVTMPDRQQGILLERTTRMEPEEVDVTFEKEVQVEEPLPSSESQLPTVPVNGKRSIDVIDNSPILGRQILVAGTELPSSRKGNRENQSVIAIAYRDYDISNGNQANVNRFVLSEPSFRIPYFARTLVMIKYHVPRNIHPNILFFPATCPKTEKLNNIEVELLTITQPITCWKHSADWFLARMFVVTETAAHYLVNQDDETCKLLLKDLQLRNLQHLSDNEVASHLRQCWIFPPESSTTQLTSCSSIHEGLVLDAIKEQDWCVEAYNCGLFVSKSLQCLASSPNGICKVIHPETGHTVLGSIEIKTDYNETAVRKARTFAGKYGQYFACEVDDKYWWDCIPSSNRVHILHQAAVLDIDYVLHCSTTETYITLFCLVHVTKEIRTMYTDCIGKWKHLMNWALDAIATFGPPPTPPKAFTPEDSYIISSHVRVWRAFRKHVLFSRKPLHPVYTIKSAVQVLYNNVKGEDERSEQDITVVNVASRTEIPLTLEQNLAKRIMERVFLNTFLIWKVQEVASVPEYEWESLTLQQVRNRLKDVIPWSRFMLQLGEELVGYATNLLGGRQQRASGSPAVQVNGEASTRISNGSTQSASGSTGSQANGEASTRISNGSTQSASGSPAVQVNAEGSTRIPNGSTQSAPGSTGSQANGEGSTRIPNGSTHSAPGSPVASTRIRNQVTVPSPGTVQRAVSRNKHRCVSLVEQFNQGDHKKLRLCPTLNHTQKLYGYTVTQSGKHKGKKKQIQKICKVCKGRAAYFCEVCGVALHVTLKKNSTSNCTTCWYKWHNADQIQ